MENLSGKRHRSVDSSVITWLGVVVERDEGRKDEIVGRRGVMEVNVLLDVELTALPIALETP